MKALIAARKRRDAIAAKADALNVIAETQAWSPEERAEYDALMAQLDTANGDIQRLEQHAEFERTAPATASFAGDGTQISSTNYSGVTQVHDNREDKPFASMGEQLLAIAQASIPHAAPDPRLFKAEISGASVSNSADGGFMLRQAYSDALLGRAREESPILGMCNVIPIPEGAESIDLPVIDETSRANGSRWGGVRVYRKAEADTVTASKPTFGRLKIDTSEIMGIAYATERLLRNASTIEAVFGNAFASEFAFKVTDELINGTGGPQCMGILGGNANEPTVSQAKETGQAAATITVNNLSAMWSHVPAKSKARGVWMINNDVEPQLDILSIPAGTGALEPRFVTYDQTGAMRIKGRPVIQLEQCATLGTVGDIIFADWGEYILSPQGAIESQSSMHVRFIYGENTFRWTYYVNGRPAWLSALTPFKGTTKLSPFVTLATRS